MPRYAAHIGCTLTGLRRIHGADLGNVGLGRLAGGVAHDFNNVLTPIMGLASLAAKALPPGEEEARRDLREIQKAAERASDLTRQLLTCSRREVFEPRLIDLNALTLEMGKLLRRLVGQDIELVTLLGTDLRPVMVNPGQMEQVITNLTVNARDAMPQGGKLTMETADVTLNGNIYPATPTGY